MVVIDSHPTHEFGEQMVTFFAVTSKFLTYFLVSFPVSVLLCLAQNCPLAVVAFFHYIMMMMMMMMIWCNDCFSFLCQLLTFPLFLGCIECMRSWLLLPMFAVSVSLYVTRRKSAAARAVYAVCCVHGSFGAAFTKCLWPLVSCTSSRRKCSCCAVKDGTETTQVY